MYRILKFYKKCARLFYKASVYHGRLIHSIAVDTLKTQDINMSALAKATPVYYEKASSQVFAYTFGQKIQHITWNGRISTLPEKN